MTPILLHDKSTIETFLRRDPYLHLYALGDLDDFFWPYTIWFAAIGGRTSVDGISTAAGSSSADGSSFAAGSFVSNANDADAPCVRQLFLLYTGGNLPVILAIAAPAGVNELRELLAESAVLLPRRFYAHLSPGLDETLRAAGYRLEPHGTYLKMGLTDPARLDAFNPREVIPFSPSDTAALVDFYDRAYPANWFDPRMLETGCYFGALHDGQIASVAGIHVYSPAYNAAALGNITTLPQYRGQGLGTQVTARLCQSLRQTVDTIGLNVKADNQSALTVYTRLGFTPVAEYEEYLIESE